MEISQSDDFFGFGVQFVRYLNGAERKMMCLGDQHSQVSGARKWLTCLYCLFLHVLISSGYRLQQDGGRALMCRLWASQAPGIESLGFYVPSEVFFG